MKNHFSLNIGLPSIVLVFIVMCLFSLSVLSLVSANADWKLSQKAITRSNSYYQACNLANEDLAILNQKLIETYTHAKDESDYLSTVSSIASSYIYSIGELQNLYVDLVFHIPDDDMLCYDIVSWKVISSENITYDDHLHVIP